MFFVEVQRTQKEEKYRDKVVSEKESEDPKWLRNHEFWHERGLGFWSRVTSVNPVRAWAVLFSLSKPFLIFEMRIIKL